MPTEKQAETAIIEPRTSFSWWSWRPGIRPRYAIALGGILGSMGLLLTSLGLFLLFFGIWDHYSSPQTQAASILKHQQGHPSSITIQAGPPGQTEIITLLLPDQDYKQLADGTKIHLISSQHLQIPIAIEAAEQRYPLSESSSLEEPSNIFVLLLLGLVLLCYPATLARWGWRDLFIERLAPGQIATLTGRIVGKRRITGTMSNRPGRIRVGKGIHWYGIALQPVAESKQQEIITFSVNEEHFSNAQEGEQIQVHYSPHLHYVYTLTSQNTPFS